MLILDDFSFFDVIFLFFMGVYREIAYYYVVPND